MSRLKDKKYYEDFYDRMTVNHFRRYAASLEKTFEEVRATIKAPKDELNRAANLAQNLYLFYEKGERYLQKETRIREWMERDRIFDEIAATPPHRPVLCNTCGIEMEPSGGHCKYDYDEPRNSRMAHYFFCSRKHIPGKIVYTDGEERPVNPNQCSACQSTNLDDKFDEMTEEAVFTCGDCGHEMRVDLSIKPEPKDSYFARDRKLYCLSEKDGEEYRHYKANLAALAAASAAQEERERHKSLYDKVAKIEKLSIFQLEARVRTELEKVGFAAVRFEKAESGQCVVLPFSFQETKADRSARSGELAAQRVLKHALEPTNWRLMSDGISSRLGQFEGRLKGFDNEEDLLKLVGGKPANSTSEVT